MHRITVRRTVMIASQKLFALAGSDSDINLLDLADIKISDSQLAGNEAGVNFWRDVSLYIMKTRNTPHELFIIEDVKQEGAIMETKAL